jgi:hypothetical protein
MRHEDVVNVLDDPLAQELLNSAIPGRVAYTGTDGSPRVVPLGFYWNGAQIVVCTAPSAPKVAALTKNPKIALTIDTNMQPPHVLLVRGTASIDIVDGVAPEFLEASRKLVDESQWEGFEAGVRAMYAQMARIAITPEWAKLLDFETRIPDFMGRLVQERNLTK